MDAATKQEIEKVRPQAGAQMAFLSSRADIVIYGGAAGGGKTWALVAEPLRHYKVKGFTATIFRRNATQIFNPGGLWSEASKLYPLMGGVPRMIRSEWIFPSGAVIRFGHLSEENTVYAYQGSQQALLCCEENTPVLMQGGGYKAIKDIIVGDKVQTLQGGNFVTAIGKPRLEECVEIEMPNGEKQIHSANHKILTNSGWISYEDCIKLLEDNCNKGLQPNQSRYIHKYGEVLAAESPLYASQRLSLHWDRWQGCGFSRQVRGRKYAAHSFVCKEYGANNGVFFEPKGYYGASKFDEYFRWKFQGLRTLRRSSFQGRRQRALLARSIFHHRVLQAVSACTVQPNQDNYFGLFLDKHREIERRPLIRLLKDALQPACEKAADIFVTVANAREWRDARICYKRINSWGRCLAYSRRYGAQPLRASKNVLKPVLKLDGVVVHIPTNSRADDLAQTQKDICYTLRYAHPYTGSYQTAVNSSVYLSSIKITPIGIKSVIDITVLSDNHYITKCGIANKNCFDELDHFTESQFIYMLSRNRSTCGVKPYVRATTNPNADSWVRKYVDWWIDRKTGYPIKERSGILRYMARVDNELFFADSAEYLIQKYGKECAPKSITFIPANLYDNKILMDANPEYLANLKSLSRVERERLLNGNWNIQPTAGNNFRREWVNVIDKSELPANLVCARGWDLASTPVKPESPDPDYTVSALLGKDMQTGNIYVIHGMSMRDTPGRVESAVMNMAAQDGVGVAIGLPQDPGQAGKAQVAQFQRKLMKYAVKTSPETGDKEIRFRPFSAACENGLVSFVRGDWNEEFFDFLEKFKTDGVHDDHADAISRAYTTLHDVKPALRISPMVNIRMRR